ncbi:MAG: HEAT repeat domain-containing protein [Acidobacteria bacterium]|nr:HEAT repeat domain-containing protein [Acidobacteriota bacterium]
MTDMESPPSGQIHPTAKRPRWHMALLMALTVMSVLVPFLFWRGTWFGRTLTEQEVGQYLSDASRPRHIQHALVQIGERIERGDRSVQRWYPEMIGLAHSTVPEIRVTLAWVLGADPQSEEFHGVLQGLLQDPEPLVRRNAALSLVRFGDASGREELAAMLRPYTVQATSAGVVRHRLEEGNPVEQGTLLARVEGSKQQATEIRSPLPGTVESRLVAEGTSVASGEDILALAPGAEHAWEALRALYLVGEREDLQDVERFARAAYPGIPAAVYEQAAWTADAISRRDQGKKP